MMLVFALIGLLFAPGSVQATSPADTTYRGARILSIEGKRSLMVGEGATYRIHLHPDASQPVTYTWDLSDGSQATGAWLSLQFEQPGLYTLRVTARNRKGVDKDTLRVHVRGTAQLPSARAITPAASAESLPSTTSTVAPVKTSSVSKGNHPPTPRTAPPLLVWPRTGYTWIVGTHLHPQQANLAAMRYRKEGFQAGIVVDTSGSGSTAYRVVVGHYGTPDAALQGRSALPADRPGAVLLLRLTEALPVQLTIR